MNSKTLIIGKTCPNCKIVEDWMKKNNVHLKTVFAEDIMDFCRENAIRSVPALVLEDGVVFGASEIIEKLMEV